MGQSVGTLEGDTLCVKVNFTSFDWFDRAGTIIRRDVVVTETVDAAGFQPYSLQPRSNMTKRSLNPDHQLALHRRMAEG